jgi:hypothetical protein
LGSTVESHLELKKVIYSVGKEVFRRLRAHQVNVLITGGELFFNLSEPVLGPGLSSPLPNKRDLSFIKS